MRGLVLSLFPGADLLGRPFEAEGYCVVRGPDILWGGDVRHFHAPAGRFDGVIGGPPCQPHSSLARRGTRATDQIPEFLRIVAEARPRWAVMENVTEADPEMPPGWSCVVLRDWDCGGLTNRRRAFWLFGLPSLEAPPKREGDPEHYTVVATDWKTKAHGRRPDGAYRWERPRLSIEDASSRQGFPGLGALIADAQPQGVSDAGRACLAIHMLGNGVPFAMGSFIARHVAASQSLEVAA